MKTKDEMKMLSKYMFTLALVSMVAWAQDDDDIDPDEYMMEDEDEIEDLEDLLTPARSAERF